MIDLKTLSVEQLNLVLHNMQVYGVDFEKRKKVIDELASREKSNVK
tara:strand:- start:582 stop:719 length:138 start_codon:yes stop_codon:yes gene_type:complete